MPLFLKFCAFWLLSYQRYAGVCVTHRVPQLCTYSMYFAAPSWNTFLCSFEEQHFPNLIWDLVSTIIFWLRNSGKEGGPRTLSKEFVAEFCGKLFLVQCPSALTQCAWSGQGKVGQRSVHELSKCHQFMDGFRNMNCSGHISRVLSSVLLPMLQLWGCCGSDVWVSQAAITGIAGGRGFCYSTEQIVVQNV